MEQAMTPSMTEEQVNKAVANYRAMLVKHAPDFASSVVQQVLGSKEFAGDQFGLFRSHVEAISDVIVRRVTVDRDRIPQQVLDATGRRQYVDKAVVATMPRGVGVEVDVVFFPGKRSLSNAEVEEQYALRGLTPDPYAQAAVNEADPAFADTHPNGTQWKNVDDRWCYAAFGQCGGKRFVSVNRGGSVWSDSWWFAGLRK